MLPALDKNGFIALMEDCFVFSSEPQVAESGSPLGLINKRHWVFDSKKVVLSPRMLFYVAGEFWEWYEMKFGRAPVQIGGMEVAAVPLITALVVAGAQKGFDVSGFYMRKSRKRYDLTKHIEGTLTGAPVILVDDFLNTGRHIELQRVRLASHGLRIAGLFVLAHRFPEKEYAFLAEHGIEFKALSSFGDFNDLGLSSALRKGNLPALPFSLTALWRRSAYEGDFHKVGRKSSPVTDGARVYLACDDGFIRAFACQNGELAWERKLARSRAGVRHFTDVLLNEGRLVVGSYSGAYYALSTQKGEVLWTSEGGEVTPADSIRGQEGDIFGFLNGTALTRRGMAVKISAATGARQWAKNLPASVESTPVYSGAFRRLIACDVNGTVFCFSENGDLLYSRKLHSRCRANGLSLSPDEMKAYIGLESGEITELDVRDGSLGIRYQIPHGAYAAPIATETALIAASLDKRVYCFERTTGRTVWMYETRGRLFCSPRLYGGKLFVGSNDSCLYVLDADNGRPLSTFVAGERIVNAPVQDVKDKNKFYLVSQSGELCSLSLTDVGSKEE